MKKIFLKTLFGFIISVIILLIGTLFNMWQEQTRSENWHPGTTYWHDYRVIFHVLSEYSLGGIAPMSEIIHGAGNRLRGQVLQYNEMFAILKLWRDHYE